MNDETQPPTEDESTEGQPAEPSAEPPQSSEPDPVEQISEYEDAARAERERQSEEALRAGCSENGCAIAGWALLFILLIFGFLFGPDFFDSDAPSQDASQTEGQGAAQTDGDPTSPGDSAFEDVFDADGNLVPLPGEWHVYNEAGVDTCVGDLSLDPNVQSVEMEVRDGGERIVVREIFEDGSVSRDFYLTRVSASATEAKYREDLSQEAERDQRIEATFSSSSTWGGKVEGCPDRGAQGSLVESYE